MSMSDKMHEIELDSMKLSSFISSAKSHVQEALDVIAYRDFDDEESIARDAVLYKDAISKLALEDLDVYRTIMNIQFSKINDIVSQQIVSNPKALRSIDDKKSFLESYLVPAIIERYLVLGNTLYFKSKIFTWSKIGTAADLLIIIKIACSMLPALNITAASNVLASVNETVSLIIDNRLQSESGEIQFNDCTFKPNIGLVDEPPSSFPRFMFSVNVWEDFTKGVEPVKAVDDLLLHIANYDEDTKRCLIDRLSMMFITDRYKKVELDAKIIMLYGPSGGNGKSTLADLLKNTLNGENCDTFSIGSFKGYSVADVERNLLMIDSEASSLHIDSMISTAIKQVVTADEMQVRQIYKSPKTVRPLTQLVVCTNAAPKAEDKSKGWDRRLEWYEISKPLNMPHEEYKELYTPKAWRYFRIMLLKNAVKLINQGRPIEPSKKIKTANKKYTDLNKNVIVWLSELASDHDSTIRNFIADKPSAMIRSMYETWCEENHETPLGKTNFNSIIESETGLVKKSAFCSTSKRSEALEWWKAQGDIPSKLNVDKKSIVCWVEE